MRFSLIVAVLPALFVCNVARAQVGTATPTPTIGETSPLGIATGSANSPTGIPLGATELASPGVSPVPSGSPRTAQSIATSISSSRTGRGSASWSTRTNSRSTGATANTGNVLPDRSLCTTTIGRAM
jgi:hypothetical protein